MLPLNLDRQQDTNPSLHNTQCHRAIYALQLKYYGEFYIDEYVIQRFCANIRIEA